MKKWWEMAEKVALVAMIALIPTQLGRHWWPEWSLVGGIRVDYLSPTLYSLDLAWIFWMAARVALGKTKEMRVNNWWLVLVLVNLVAAENKWAAVMGWMRWGQWWTVVAVAIKERERFRKILGAIVPWWVLAEAGLGLAQVINGGSLGGVFWLLGERRFSLGSVGAALWGVDGVEWVRAMGTFSHPNSLAGFGLLVAGWWWTQRREWRDKSWGWATMVGLGVIMFLSASRTVWLAAGIFGLLLLAKKGKFKEKMGWSLVALGGVIAMLGIVAREYELRNFISGWDQQSATRRVELLTQAGRMIKERPIAGIGLNNWFNWQTKTEIGGGRWRQPVHNGLGLWLTETGLVGLLIAGASLVKQAKNKRGWRWIIVAGIIMMTALADHYWLTLPQNRWLWGLIWAII